MLTQRAIPMAILVASLLAGGCEIERFFPNDVGNGAGRLMVRNSAVLVGLISDDKTCGFANDAVLQAYRQDGELGSLGTVTWSVQDCTLDFGPKLLDQGTDCNGEVKSVSGKVVVTATRVVQGILTGNPEQPVIPQSPDAVTIQISADMTDYLVHLSDKNAQLTVRHGHIAETVSPHLAQSASLGICGVPTTNLTLNSVEVKDALYTVDDNGHIFDVEVPHELVKAQLGSYGGFENWLDGSVTVWDTEVNLTEKDHTLDPDYTKDVFDASFACTPDLATPVTYECLPLTPKLADGAAKLTVNDVGNAISIAVADTGCGFASPDAVSHATVTGEVGKDGGEVVYRIDQPCALGFPVKTQIARDCAGKTTYAEGQATITGTMRVRGRLTGDPAQPVIPTSRDPAQIDFHLDFDRWRISDDKTDQSLEITVGTVTGTMQPRMGLDKVTGACSIATPVVTFSHLTYAPGAHAIVRAQGNALGVDIDGSALDAQSGAKDGVENKLSGSIVVGGDTYTIPLDGNPVLDPTYDAAGYAASFACAPNLQLPTSDDQCNFHDVIGNGAARLIVQTVGTLATLINNDSNCGFEDKFGVLIFPTETIGAVGELGSMTWDVAGCTVGAGALSVLSDDCLGGSTFYQGTADVTATRTVEGMRTTQFLVIDAIEPRDHEEVQIYLHDVPLHDFVTYPLAAGESEPLGKLTIHDGTLSATVEPATGQRADDPVQFDVPTPVARISDVHLRNAHATLEAQGKLFEIVISDTNLHATNGTLDMVSNHIDGDIVFDNDDVAIGGALNPTFNQQSFDQSYVCTPNLLGVIN